MISSTAFDGVERQEGIRQAPIHSLTPCPQYAIRPTIRNHSTLKRDEIIDTVATCVGPNHIVDLKNYDLLILVDFYKAQYNSLLPEPTSANLLVPTRMSAE